MFFDKHIKKYTNNFDSILKLRTNFATLTIFQKGKLYSNVGLAQL